MDIILNTKKIIENKLSVNDYLYLNYLYLKKNNEACEELLELISSIDDDYLK